MELGRGCARLLGTCPAAGAALRFGTVSSSCSFVRGRSNEKYAFVGLQADFCVTLCSLNHDLV